MKSIKFLAAVVSIIIIGCTKTGTSDFPGTSDLPGIEPDFAANIGTGGNGDSGTVPQPGVITAGEWNDLTNWNFFNNILADSAYKGMQNYWGFYNKYRIAVNIGGTDGRPITDATVQLKDNGTLLFTAKTDNKGNCELWPVLFDNAGNINFSRLQMIINKGAMVVSNIKPYEEGVNSIVLPALKSTLSAIDVSFVVDATSSMSDELEYLKTELYNVITRIKNDNPSALLNTASVFYRDEGDSYLTKVSGFTNNINKTIDFIKDQGADGGGDFPEAVHTALDKAVNSLQWSSAAKTRVLFLMLDAPPHYEPAILQSIYTSINTAAAKGIKIIPVTASGIDKETEFLMRFMAISTNGTYVFITNDSGVGNDHLKATVGDYEVEFLNNLMVRLVDKYAQ